MLNPPRRQFMFCAPDEGAAAVVVCRASEAHRYTSKPIFVKATAVRTRNLGALEVHGTWASSTPVDGPTAEASRPAYESAGPGPSAVDVIQIQDTAARPESIQMAGNCLVANGHRVDPCQAGQHGIATVRRH